MGILDEERASPMSWLDSLGGGVQPAFDEQGFQQGIRGTDWFNEFVKQYGEEPDLRPMSNDQAQGPNYDYRKAWAAGIRPERDPYDQNRFHWSSSTGSGDMLKADNHPTAWKEYFMRQHGMNPDSLDPELVKRMLRQ
jgi:hypothetical protein